MSEKVMGMVYYRYRSRAAAAVTAASGERSALGESGAGE